MIKKGNNIKLILESSIIGGSLLVSSLLGYKIYKLNKLDKELTKDYYKKYAEAMVETSNWDGVIFSMMDIVIIQHMKKVVKLLPEST